MNRRSASEQLAIERRMREFEGLVRTTARQIMQEGVELDEDEVVQLLQIKVWQSVEGWNVERGLSMRRWVFGNICNVRKDILKRPRRRNASVDELRDLIPDGFEGRYLSVDADVIYAEAEDEPVVLPSTLTRMEKRVIRLRLKGRRLEEIDSATGLSRSQRERIMRSIRLKLADWAPDAPAARSAPTAPLPVAAPTRTPVAA